MSGIRRRVRRARRSNCSTVIELQHSGLQHYRSAAVRLEHLRKLTNGTEHAADIDEFIADLRLANKRCPRLQQELDRVRLPVDR
ncbi:hypothetical protein ET445_10550 [Agromyces protaetiae]|uniref:Uncharacterized protein n=1 Tax=Agromyces protaetiae TaxID=2509455 RepID=A0A4P6FGV4_9MICO|nr:hypothetical protein [Agromyces protaetiae]QAY73719.1 hypothetical protein ET445_10550 [Agromyces protaetiae]